MNGIFVFLIFLSFVDNANSARQGKVIALSDEEYGIILRKLTDTFITPLQDRTKVERSVIRKYYRWIKSGMQITVGPSGTTLYLDGKQLIRREEIKNVIRRANKESKNAGTRKLAQRIQSRFIGCSERKVIDAKDNSKSLKNTRGRFVNKALLQPITATHVMERVQIDLVDMKEEQVTHRDNNYRYILTVMDIFSRYLWLRPLTRKKASHVAHEINHIFREHGPPRILQCDRGGEFKGNTRDLCKHIGIKIINSRAYHPQSQGKVERSHRGIRDKIRYDLLKGGSNWVKAMPEYQSILNDEPKQELGGKSPFEIYYNRKSNFVVQPNAESDEDSEGESVFVRTKVWPTLSKSDLNNINERKTLLTKIAYDGSKKCSKTMINRALKRFPLPIYKLKERVLVRHPFSGGKKAPRRRMAIPATVVARNIPLSKYKVKFRNPDTKVAEEEWVMVNDMTSKTHKKETERKKFDNVDDFMNAAEREKRLESLFEELTRNDRTGEAFESVGYTILLNPASDGNCQFSAIADQLRRQSLGDMSAYEVREQAVDYMTEFRISPFNERPDFGTLFDSERYHTYDNYINAMLRDSTFGDHLTLQALSELFFVRIHIVSVEGQNYDRIIIPREDVGDIPTLTLGYYPEGNGEHYISMGENIDFVRQRVDEKCRNVEEEMEHVFEATSNNILVEDEAELVSEDRVDGDVDVDGVGDGDIDVVGDVDGVGDGDVDVVGDVDGVGDGDVDVFVGDVADVDVDVDVDVDGDREDDVDNDDVDGDGEINKNLMFACANAACIAALLCSCEFAVDSTENERDEERDIYFDTYEPKNGIITVKEVRERHGATSGVIFQLKRILQAMDRPRYERSGRVVSWSSATIRIRPLTLGWWRIESVIWPR